MSDKREVVVVTGLSGAGKSTALHALEDLGFYCVDNLPTPLLAATVETCEQAGIFRIGLGMDVRIGAFLKDTVQALKAIENPDRNIVILFLDASDESLLFRYKETRRPHPLIGPFLVNQRNDRGALAILDGIRLERETLTHLKTQSSLHLDTTSFSSPELRKKIIQLLSNEVGGKPLMLIRLLSFGYKYGIPLDADLVIDVRFLKNPYFELELRDLTGEDPPVREYILKDTETLEYLEHTKNWISYGVPRYEREGKSYLSIAMGCTGGRHRSVVIASMIAEHLKEQFAFPIVLYHRDIRKLVHRPEILTVKEVGSV